MTSRLPLRQYQLQKAIENAATTGRIIRAQVGSKAGDIYLTGSKNYIWVQIDGVEQVVFNRRIVPFAGAPVVVGTDAINPGLVQVLDYNYGADGENFPGGAGAHADTHYWYGGTDIVKIATRQIMWLAPFVTGDFEVTIYQGMVPTPGGFGWLETTVVDLTSHKPVSGFRYVLFYTDSAGALQLADGTPAATVDIEDIPDLPAGGLQVICAVRMYSTQIKLSDTSTTSDVIDMRFGNKGGSGGSGSNATSLQGVPVSAEAPDSGDVLFYDGVTWNPGTIISHEHVYQEDLSPLCNNSTTHFATAQKFEAGSTQVYLNGLLQDVSNNYDGGDYAEGADLQSIDTVAAPQSSDSLFVNYIVSINTVGS